MIIIFDVKKMSAKIIQKSTDIYKNNYINILQIVI